MGCFAALAMTMFCLLTTSPALAKDVYFTTSDNVRLHYTETGPKNAPVIVFVPGWTMPGWIFAPEQKYFSKHYQVVEFDPRGQGLSEIAPTGYIQSRRGQDIAELIARLPGRVVLVGWSLGVLDSLAYIHQSGDARVAAMVLIDNSVGENPPPTPSRSPPHRGPILNHAQYMQAFVASMFHTKQPQAYLNRLTEAALRTPEPDAYLLLRYPVNRSYWKEALFSTNVPVLYAVRPHLQGQADNLMKDRPNSTIAIFPHAGHALFVDNAKQFNTLMGAFLRDNGL
jgi:microsomal epoxide hydrolase